MTDQTTQPEFTAASIYAEMRRRGTTYIRPQYASLISGVRRLARADGYAVSQYRGSSRGMTRNQARDRSYSLSLNLPGSDLIVTPDAVPV